MKQSKIVLSSYDIPKEWYNILADLPTLPKPSLNPKTKKPMKYEDYLDILSPSLIDLELTKERWIKIPEDVLDIYIKWRPTYLYRAYSLERELETSAKIFYKFEGYNPTGSHKPNSAIPLSYYSKKDEKKRITTETSGQWGSALALAANLFNLECIIYMEASSYEKRPLCLALMKTYGASVYRSPSNRTVTGREVLSKDIASPGSIGIAASEAIEEARNSENTNYIFGSVNNNFLITQSIIGLEAEKQLNSINEKPDIIIASCGGGANLGGISLPFIRHKLDGSLPGLEIIAAESTAAPVLTKGKLRYEHADSAGLTSLLYMYSLDREFTPDPIFAGGLRYHGNSPTISLLYDIGIIRAKAYDEKESFKAAVLFSKSEGIIPAAESAYAIKATIDEAINCKITKEEKTILLNIAGNGLIDYIGYDSYLSFNKRGNCL